MMKKIGKFLSLTIPTVLVFALVYVPHATGIFVTADEEAYLYEASQPVPEASIPKAPVIETAPVYDEEPVLPTLPDAENVSVVEDAPVMEDSLVVEDEPATEDYFALEGGSVAEDVFYVEDMPTTENDLLEESSGELNPEGYENVFNNGCRCDDCRVNDWVVGVEEDDLSEAYEGIDYAGEQLAFQDFASASSPVFTHIRAPEFPLYLPVGGNISNLAYAYFTAFTADSEMQFPIEGHMISGLNNMAVGRQEVTLTFLDMSDTFFVEVFPVPPSSNLVLCTITTPIPILVGGRIEDSLMRVDISCSINFYFACVQVTSDMVTGLDTSTPGLKTFTITLSGLTVEGQIEVVGGTFPPDTILAPKYPDEIPLIPQGGTITAARIVMVFAVPNDNPSEAGNDGSSMGEAGSFGIAPFAIAAFGPQPMTYLAMFLLTDDMVTGFDNSRVGQQEITVTHMGLTTTMTVEVFENPAFVQEGTGTGPPAPDPAPNPDSGSGSTLGSTPSSTPVPTGTAAAPQTGDDAPFALLILSLLLSGVTFSGAVMVRRRVSI